MRDVAEEPRRAEAPRAPAPASQDSGGAAGQIAALQGTAGNAAVAGALAGPAQHAKQRVGTWGTVGPSALTTGERLEKSFSSRDVAVTFATSLEGAHAVFAEGTSFVIYPVEYPDWFSSFTFKGTRMYPDAPISNVKGEPGVLAFVTEDGAAILPHQYGNADDYKSWMDQQDTLKPGANPFDNARRAFGGGMKDLVAEDQFLKQFGLALRASALSTLDRSAAEAADRRARFGQGLPPADSATIASVGKKLLDVDAELERREHAYTMATAGARHDTTAEKATHEQQMADLRVQREAVLLAYPLLSRIDHFDDELGAPAGGPKVPTGALATFLQQPAEVQTKALAGATDDVDKAIAVTRTNVMSGEIDLWGLTNVVAAAKSGLGITDKERLRWIDDKVQAVAAGNKMEKQALQLFQLAFGLAAMALTGGTAGWVLAGLAAGAGAYDAVKATAEFAAAQAAANTDVNKGDGLIPQDLVSSEADLVFAWISVGLSFADAVAAVRAVKAAAGGTVDVAKLETREAIADVARTRKNVEEAALLQAAKLPPGPTTGALRAAVLERLTPELAELHKDLKVTIVPKHEFVAQYDSTAHAATLIRTGSKGELIPEVIFREQGNAFAIREEAIHLQQLAEPANAKKMALLSEDGQLGKWKDLGAKDRLDVYKSKIDLELDGQLRLKAETEVSAEELEEIDEAIEELRKKQAEVYGALADPSLAERPGSPWLTDDAPRLFNKPRLPRTGHWSGAKGDSIWYSYDPAVLTYARNGVPYSGGYPDFQQWALYEIELPAMAGDAADFREANRILAEELTSEGLDGFTFRGKPTQSSVEEMLKVRDWTWHHHHGGKKMILVPWSLHNGVQHTGGASISRLAKK
ncbi:HNH endonuclease [Kribbella sp. NPDC051620]|uniref:HNH endonuclease n=1 Tax=Kribbella sp. NPDC051620 TaxID=3364120 RepID=UPI003792788A